MITSQAPILLGAVAYHERVVPIWERFKDYFEDRGAPIDYVLYSSYERLVLALLKGDVDVAWNTNTAFIYAEHLASRRLLILGMRDIDASFASVIVTRNAEQFERADELAGRKLALGSRDSGHAAILPLHFLAREGLDAERECELVRFDSDLGKHGDTGDSEMKVVRAVSAGDVDAGALGSPTWERFRSEGVSGTAGLTVSWRSPAYFHCNFTALPNLDTDRSSAWRTALLAMDYNDPTMRAAMDLEGVKRWLPCDRSGYASLIEAMQEQGYLA